MMRHLTNIRLFVNIRASYADEVNTMLSFFSNQLRLTRVSAYYQNESISVAGFKSANLSIAFNLLGLKVPASISRPGKLRNLSPRECTLDLPYAYSS